jgi:lipoate-protein ligase B
MQEAHRAQMLTSKVDPHVFFVEHRPTITLGRGEKGQNLHQSESWFTDHGFDVVRVNRGGMVTYHGPGQLVVYPVIRISDWGWGVKQYIAALEQSMVDVLQHFDIQAARLDQHPGTYVQGQKIGSVGIHVRKYISIHGLALNVHPNLQHFAMLTPCGIASMQATSMEAQGANVSFDQVQAAYMDVFSNLFSCALLHKPYTQEG